MSAPAISDAIRRAVVDDRLTYAAAAELVYGVNSATTRARVSAHLHNLQSAGVIERAARGVWVMATGSAHVTVDTADEAVAIAVPISTTPDFFAAARARARAKRAARGVLAGLPDAERVRVLCDLIVDALPPEERAALIAPREPAALPSPAAAAERGR